MRGGKLKSLIGDTLAFGISGFAVRIASFFMIPLYTQFLSTEDYAIADLVSLSVQLAVPLLTCSISDALLRFGLDNSKDIQKTIGTSFLVILLGSAVAVLPCVIVGMAMGNWVLAAFAFLYFVAQTGMSYFGAYFKCSGLTKMMAAISALSGIVTIAANVVAIAYLGLGLVGYWIGNVLGCTLGVVLYICLGGYRAFSSLRQWDRECLGEMLRYSIPLIPNSVFWWINSSMDRFLLTALSTLSFVGLYSVASRIPQILSTIGGYFFQAWNISIFRDFGSVESRRFIRKGFDLVSTLLFAGSGCLILLSEPLGAILFSGEFFQAWTLVPLLVTGTSVSLLNQFLGSIFTASKETGAIFSTTAMGSIVNIVLCAAFISLFGGIGAVVATLLSYIAVYVARAASIARRYPDLGLSHRWTVIQIAALIIVSVFAMNGAVLIGAMIMVAVLIVGATRYFLRHRSVKD